MHSNIFVPLSSCLHCNGALRYLIVGILLLIRLLQRIHIFQKNLAYVLQLALHQIAVCIRDRIF